MSNPNPTGKFTDVDAAPSNDDLDESGTYQPTEAAKEPTDQSGVSSAEIGEQELDGISKDNILDEGETRDARPDNFKADDELDAQVDAATKADPGMA